MDIKDYEITRTVPQQEIHHHYTYITPSSSKMMTAYWTILCVCLLWILLDSWMKLMSEDDE